MLIVKRRLDDLGREAMAIVLALALYGCALANRDVSGVMQERMTLRVSNEFPTSASVYLQVGVLRIHLVTVPGECFEEVVLPENLDGLTATVVVWIPSELLVASSHQFVLEPGARLDLSVTPARPVLIARKSS